MQSLAHRITCSESRRGLSVCRAFRDAISPHEQPADADTTSGSRQVGWATRLMVDMVQPGPMSNRASSASSNNKPMRSGQTGLTLFGPRSARVQLTFGSCFRSRSARSCGQRLRRGEHRTERIIQDRNMQAAGAGFMWVCCTGIRRGGCETSLESDALYLSHFHVHTPWPACVDKHRPVVMEGNED